MTQKGVNTVTVVVTGLAWIGRGTRSIDSAIEEMLTDATDEIQAAAYMITKGAEDFIKLIGECLSRGVRVTLIVNRFRKQPQEIQHMIVQLARQHPHFKLLEFDPKDKNEDLHAKSIVVDRSKALVGSPNLSWKGFVLNHELAVVVEGPAAARIGNLLDLLAKDSRTSEVEF
jgi:phosphatidylserine/phosphatidylglycerophosphate/cardiolipin synthase-like enzyme